MPLSIPNVPAVSAENSIHRNFGEGGDAFSQGLERLSTHLKRSGSGVRPAAYGPEPDTAEKVKAAELGKNIRNANDSVSESRIAEQGLGYVGELLTLARGLAFSAINEPGRAQRDQDQVEYSQVLREIDRLVSSLIFGGGPLLDGSASFGTDGALEQVSLTSVQGSIIAIGVIDRAIGEVADRRLSLGDFRSNRLADVGAVLRGAVANLSVSDQVVRDPEVALKLAQGLAAELAHDSQSSLLGSGTAAAQILASLVGRL